MKSKIAIFLLSLLWGSYTFGQQTLLFDSGRMVDSVLSTVPTKNVVNTATGIEVSYDFSSAVILQDELFPGHYLWRMDGFGLNEVSGTPSTLLRIDQFGIPDGKVCQIEVVETAYKDFEYVLSPARPPLIDNGNEIHTKDNVKPIDSTIAIFPEQIVQAEGIQKYRGRGILNVRVAPIQYNASTGKTRVFHRGHGNPTCWGDSRFTQSDIEKLSNGNKLPVVFSVNCQTGQFNEKNCFTETFLRKSNGGCVAIYGATESSLSGYNDVLAGGMFDAIWPDPGLRIIMPGQTSNGTTPTPTYQLGQILNQGLARMSEIYGASAYYGRYTREIFHCFGDPGMRIYTEVPTAFSGVTVNRGNDNVTVSLSNGERATITFYNLINGKVTSYVGSNAVYDTKTSNYVTVCVSGHNKIPDVRQGITPSDIYIQNETITGNKTYIGKIIKIGTNVTGSKPQGDVVIKAGSTVNFYGNDVQILPGTTIEQGADVTIITQ